MKNVLREDRQKCRRPAEQDGEQIECQRRQNDLVVADESHPRGERLERHFLFRAGGKGGGAGPVAGRL